MKKKKSSLSFQKEVKNLSPEVKMQLTPTDRLKHYTNRYQIYEMLKIQQKYGWNIFQERELLESSFTTRFNFFLVAYSLFFTCAFIASDYLMRIFACTCSIIVLSFLWLGIYRLYSKFVIIMEIIYNIPSEDTPFHVIKIEMNKRQKRWFQWECLSLLGITIPFICIITLCAQLVRTILFDN